MVCRRMALKLDPPQILFELEELPAEEGGAEPGPRKVIGYEISRCLSPLAVIAPLLPATPIPRPLHPTRSGGGGGEMR